MTQIQLLVLAGIAGFTIFLGLPIAVIPGIKPSVKGILCAAATGILLFLAVEILGKVPEAGEHAAEQWVSGEIGPASCLLVLGLAVGGVFVGILGTPMIERFLIRPLLRRRFPEAGPREGAGRAHPVGPALFIATGSMIP
jgi:ZIP family zinc transporter